MTFNGILNSGDAQLNGSYANLNQSSVAKNPKIARMGKAAPISSVQMAKDLYRKGQTASQSSSRATAQKLKKPPVQNAYLNDMNFSSALIPQ